MRRFAIVLASVAALLLAAAQAAEAPNPKPEPKAAQPAPPSAPAGPPPYEAQLLRMAEMMGALAYLRDLCGAGDGGEFRTKMKSLLDADGAGEPERDLLAGAYNRGFDGYRLTYRTCTPAAGEIIARYLAETAKLAAEVASRYGG